MQAQAGLAIGRLAWDRRRSLGTDLKQYFYDNDPVKVGIFDALGRYLYNEELLFVDFISQLNVNNQPIGIYLLELTNSKNQTFRFKFVINK